MDIGGEAPKLYILKNKIIKRKVLILGYQEYIKCLISKDPISKIESEELKGWFNQQTDGFLNDINCNTLIGASGSFETLYELIHKKQFQSNTSIHMPFDSLTNTLNSISFSSYKREK